MKRLIMLIFFSFITYSFGYQVEENFTGKLLKKYENGKLKSKENIEEILKDRKGKYKGYYPNGHLEEEGEVFQGEEAGLWKYYNEEGKLLSEGRYKEGKKIGKWKLYNFDGSLLKIENYKEK